METASSLRSPPGAASASSGLWPLPPALTLRGVCFRPALFCAPMAGLTHSAFRRLVADYGGFGGLFTEMLCGRWLLTESLRASPSLKRRAVEGPVIYQLMLADAESVPAVIERLNRLAPAGLDLNCACPAPSIRRRGAGSELCADPPRLAAILRALRRHFAGPLSVKLRLGPPRADWRAWLLELFRVCEDGGVDAVILHPRFLDEKLRRRARHELLPDLAAATRLPLIASGDIHSPAVVRANPGHFAGVAGVMVGRMAVVRPWVFRDWLAGAGARPEPLEVWGRFARYAAEDFEPGRDFYRVKAFTRYFAKNFQFGHTLFAAAQSAGDFPTLRERAVRFLEPGPAWVSEPDLQGLA